MAIEELISRVFAIRDAAHLEHLKTSSYAAHMALGDLYEALPGTLDAFVECYQGRIGKIGKVNLQKLDPSVKLEKALPDELSWIEENCDKLCKDVTYLQNLLDAIAEEMSTCYYKLSRFE
jgi:hypothetical protein